MSYIDKNLLPDEQIIYRARKHYIIYLVPFLWLIASIGLYIETDTLFSNTPFPFFKQLYLLPLGFAIITGLNQWLTYVTSEFVVTNKRLMMREGFFFRHTQELYLRTISQVMVNQSLVAQLLNYGTVIINPFGGSNDVFTEIDSPLEFQKQTQLQLDKILR